MITEPIHNVDLLTNDLYQFTCSYSYFVSNKHEQIATFQVFFRKHPFGGSYAVCGGIRGAKEFIRNLTITNEQIQYIKSLFPHMKEQYFEWLKKNINCSLKIKSLNQGEIVFAKEPIISYTGPISIVQLLQTPFLNLIGFSSLVATNATRMVKAASSKSCIEFGIRRAQGPDGGLSASQYSFLGGFSGTSNIQASKLLGIPCIGTMSHAYITSFTSLNQADNFQLNGVDIKQRSLKIRHQLQFSSHDGQLAAFLMYAKAFPNNFVTLIDSFSTLGSGILNTIIVGKALIEAGYKDIGIRLDSGDLCEYSKKCRHVWQKYIPQVRLKIVASDDLTEQRIFEMQKNKSEIDVYAIGTNIATCKKQPALGLVCKLVQLSNVPLMKFSETSDKATFPGKKSCYRIWTKDEENSKFDLIALQNQQIKQHLIVVDANNHLKKYQLKVHKKIELHHQWSNKQKIQTVQEGKKYFQNTRKTINQKVFELTGPATHHLMITQGYLEVFQKTQNKNIVLSKFD